MTCLLLTLSLAIERLFFHQAQSQKPSSGDSLVFVPSSGFISTRSNAWLFTTVSGPLCGCWAQTQALLIAGQTFAHSAISLPSVALLLCLFALKVCQDNIQNIFYLIPLSD